MEPRRSLKTSNKAITASAHIPESVKSYYCDRRKNTRFWGSFTLTECESEVNNYCNLSFWHSDNILCRPTHCCDIGE